LHAQKNPQSKLSGYAALLIIQYNDIYGNSADLSSEGADEPSYKSGVCGFGVGEFLDFS